MGVTEPSSRIDVTLGEDAHALARVVQAVEGSGAVISSIMTVKYCPRCFLRLLVPFYGRSGMDRLLLGSIADRVVGLAPCSVMMVRDKDHEDSMRG